MMGISGIFWNGHSDMSQSLTKVFHILNEFSLLKKCLVIDIELRSDCNVYAATHNE